MNELVLCVLFCRSPWLWRVWLVKSQCSAAEMLWSVLMPVWRRPGNRWALCKCPSYHKGLHNSIKYTSLAMDRGLLGIYLTISIRPDVSKVRPQTEVYGAFPLASALPPFPLHRPGPRRAKQALLLVPSQISGQSELNRLRAWCYKTTPAREHSALQIVAFAICYSLHFWWQVTSF